MFAVIGPNGSGWGRYKTRAEAEARAANLSLITGTTFSVALVIP